MISGMHPQQRWLLTLNVLGGIGVLGSYIVGLATHPGTGDFLWGGVPQALKPFYNITMLSAAAGYFPFTFLLLYRTDARSTRIAGRYGFGWFLLLYALILIPSALWLPLTLSLLEGWDPALWLTIRVVLGLVGIGSLGLLAALLTLSPVTSRRLHKLAIAGAVAFCMQTALLDATIWPAYFPRGTSATVRVP